MLLKKNLIHFLFFSLRVRLCGSVSTQLEMGLVGSELLILQPMKRTMKHHDHSILLSSGQGELVTCGTLQSCSFSSSLLFELKRFPHHPNSSHARQWVSWG